MDGGAKMLAGAAGLTGEQLSSYLEREGVRLADFESWRLALEEGAEPRPPRRSAFDSWSAS